MLLVALLYEFASPIMALALTGGPSQPEFASFEPVGTTGMVSEFSGAFTYNLPVLNIPGPNGSGYALSLSYHGGTSPEEEASWVGYGWTLSPGSIVRNKRGFADDDSGATVKYWNRVPENWTATVGTKTNVEAFSSDVGTVALSGSIRYNNYRGFSTSVGATLNFPRFAQLNYDRTDGDGSFSFGINPPDILNEFLIPTINSENPAPVRATMMGFSERFATDMAAQIFTHTFSEKRSAMNVSEYTGAAYNFSINPLFAALALPIGGEVGLNGGYSYQKNKAYDAPDGLKAFGYMYSGYAGDNDIMDYYVEKESMYSPRDWYLGIPFSNADNFTATGEGVAGGFRLHSSRSGHFHPNSKSSSINIYQVGVEAHVGPLNIGVGADAGVGSQSLSVGRWGPVPDDYLFPLKDQDDEAYSFRFNNDLGGSVVASPSDEAVQAGVHEHPAYGEMPTIPSSIATRVNDGRRNGRSSYIGYHTNAEMMELPDPGCNTGLQGGVFYNAYNKNYSSRRWVDRGKANVRSGIGEFEITNQSGLHYLYGLPVYSRKEKNLQFGLDGLAASSIDNNYNARKSVTAVTADVVVGEERDAPYASMYLLTEITTPDYVDRTSNGPTHDDFGGYTRFAYKRTAGSNDKTLEEDDGDSWYRWRVPYTGLLYDRRTLSEPRDDIGSVVMGEKEIYYLDSIETKTHLAIFVTSQRADAYEAHHDEFHASNGDKPDVDVNTNKSHKLDRIELYAKKGATTEMPVLIQTVHFEYDYALSSGMPNAVDEGGKLTLKKVWFEHNGTTNARIAPYQFGYEYRPSSFYSSLPADVRAMYDGVIRYGDSVTTGAQNPSYTPFNIDRWGNYQYDGAARYARFQQWLDQTPDRSAFDPAAWQLKWIKLPSGGEIQVQYEQNDYCYVQDRPAMAMVSLKHDPDAAVLNRFYLNVTDDLGIPDTDPGSPELLQLKEMIRKRFMTDGEKIYFKFLYPLQLQTANFTNCVTEYISGYLSVREAGIDPGGKGVYVDLMSESDTAYSVPRDVCLDLFNATKSGNLRYGSRCDASSAGISNGMSVMELVMSLVGKMVNDVTGNAFTCQTKFINYSESYLRIPMTRAKRGGGIRVKRILTYDPGIDQATSGSASIYGTEYLYQTEKGTSSGVAINEPPTGREENALVGYMAKRRYQNWVERVISGRDQEQFEGPIGETILPSPSVGYSRVVARNIFMGKTHPGFTVSEFHTAKDFPFDGPAENTQGSSVASTPIYDGSDGDDWIPQVVPGIGYGLTNRWLTQGYRFIINNMHGQIKRVATYTGDLNNRATWVTVAEQMYTYFKPGEKVPMAYGINDIRMEYPGKEMEVVFDSRVVEDIEMNGSVEGDLSVALTFPLPAPVGSVVPGGEYVEAVAASHVTSKVVRYPVIMKSVKVLKDGVEQITENVGFDPATGNPILQKTYDGYNGLTLQQSSNHKGVYYMLSEPAYWEYPEMGQRAASERLKLATTSDLVIEKWYDQVHYLNFRSKSPNADVSDITSKLSGGDLVRLTTPAGQYRGVYQIGTIAGSRVQLLSNSYDQGTISFPENVNIEIVRSGRGNRLSAVASAITTYGVMPAVSTHPHH